MHSEYLTQASYTYNKAHKSRWHIFNDDIIELGDNARATILLQRASDKTYLQKYGFYNDQPYLDSGAKLELFGQSAYAVADMHVFQELRTDEYRTNKAIFNEFYFKKCICAAIIFRTVDDYLETHKDSAKRPTGFWYKAGGYKLNIVPFTIAKILSCIPEGYSLDWNKIWQKQSLSAAFMREIEIVTKKTNDFICDSHGMIVTEYCKKATTWEEYRDNTKHELSSAFIDELMPSSVIQEAERAAVKDEAELQKLDYQVEIVRVGEETWQRLYSEGSKRGLLTYQDKTLLERAINACKTGNLINMMNSRKIMAIKDKLEAEGIL
jgi:hypothetical protein